MTVAELIAELRTHDPNRVVVMQKDGEGNGYSPLADMWAGVYCPESTWSGEMHIDKLTASLIAEGYGEEDCAPDGVEQQPALCLCPTN